MQGHILGQGHRQVKPQGQIGVALLEAVDLLFGFAAALGQQHLAGLDGRGVQGSEAVSAVGGAQDLHHPLHLLLRGRQQLHEAGESPGGSQLPWCNISFLLCISVSVRKNALPSRVWDESAWIRFVVPPKFSP